MFIAIMAWFPVEVRLALSSILIAAGIDAALTAVLALQGKIGEPFSWRKLPQFLLSNVLWPAVGLIIGGALVKYYPDVREVYFGVTAAVDLWLARDWRNKFNCVIGIKLPVNPQNINVTPPVISVPLNTSDVLTDRVAEQLTRQFGAQR